MSQSVLVAETKVGAPAATHFFFRTWFGDNFDGPEVTRDHLEATLMVRRQQKITFRKTDGEQATRDQSEVTLMVWRQPVKKFSYSTTKKILSFRGFTDEMGKHGQNQLQC